MSDKRGKTLWETLRDQYKEKQEESPEFKVPNPLKARIKDFVSIETADLSGKNFVVREIDVYKRVIQNTVLQFTDYALQNHSGKEDKWVTVRVNPISNPDPYSHKHSDVLLLFPDYECPYDQDLHEKILPSGVLEVKDGDKVLATYTCLNGVKEFDIAEVSEISDPAKPLATEKITYWTFGRELEDGAVEFYFVEMNTDTGFFQMYRGVEISEKDITLFPAAAEPR